MVVQIVKFTMAEEMCKRMAWVYGLNHSKRELDESYENIILVRAG